MSGGRDGREPAGGQVCREARITMSWRTGFPEQGTAPKRPRFAALAKLYGIDSKTRADCRLPLMGCRGLRAGPLRPRTGVEFRL